MFMFFKIVETIICEILPSGILHRHICERLARGTDSSSFTTNIQYIQRQHMFTLYFI